MRSHTAIMVVSAFTLLLLGCTTSASAPAAGTAGARDFSYLRTPDSFRSFGRDAETYETAYRAPTDFTESASRNSFVYWNAVMAVRTGHDCFALKDVKTNRSEEIGTSRLDPGSPVGPTAAGAPLNTRPPSHVYEFKALTVFTDCTAEGAIDAKDYLSRTNRPDLAPRKASGH